MAKLERPKRAERRYESKYIVHDGHKFVYFVVQKVACSSVKMALLPLFDVRTKRFEHTLQDGSRAVRIHKIFDRSPHQIDKADLLGGQYRDHFRFAFVRNPWDRLVSCHAQKLAFVPKDPKFEQVDLNSPGEERFYPGMPFAEFVEAVHATSDEEANAHFRSQHTVVCDADGRVMADFVGRFENLRDDFARVAEKIGEPGLGLPHRLKSRARESRPYTDYYDERLKELVAERYERYIETFGYSY